MAVHVVVASISKPTRKGGLVQVYSCMEPERGL